MRVYVCGILVHIQTREDDDDDDDDDDDGNSDGGGGSTSIHAQRYSQFRQPAARERADVFFFPGDEIGSIQ